MKRLLTLVVMAAMTLSIIAQPPQKMSYQAVIRDAGNNLVTSHAIGMRISILQGSATGTEIYKEIYNPNPQTNANGLESVEIGGGITLTGSFSTINWAAGPFFLKTETDPTGGTNYTITGTSQLLSVPYALYSATAQTADYNNLTNKPNLSGYLTSESDPVFAAFPAHGITNGNITNWNSAYSWGNHAGLYRSISWVPAWTDITGKPGFATVATSGSYNDLTNKPVFDGSWTGITGKPTSVAGYGITDAVTIAGDQTISGIKTFSSDLLVNEITIGTGKGGNFSNTAIGYYALPNNTTGDCNTAIGFWALSDNRTGENNTACGANALKQNYTGIANTACGLQALMDNFDGSYNTANGMMALALNQEGYNNTAVGYYALYSNITGSENTASGGNALYNNVASYNTANGYNALYSNTDGSYNTATGWSALIFNQTGSSNTASGANALKSNTSGFYNTASGMHALIGNTSGFYNTASGLYALSGNTTGYYNTATGAVAGDYNQTGNYITCVGYNADVSYVDLTNATAIGSNAAVNASNKVRIGDASVTAIEGQVNWSVGSDRRLKDNIEYSEKLGLEFVNSLKTATFTYRNDPNKKHHDGLIAQDVEESMNKLGLEFSGLIVNDNEEKILNLSYAEFVIPLINAVKEQQKQIEDLKKEIAILKSR